MKSGGEESMLKSDFTDFHNVQMVQVHKNFLYHISQALTWSILDQAFPKKITPKLTALWCFLIC